MKVESIYSELIVNGFFATFTNGSILKGISMQFLNNGGSGIPC